MICPRHGNLTDRAPYGYPMCDRCFREAINKAEDILLEEQMRVTYERYHATNTLRVRLRWEP